MGTVTSDKEQNYDNHVRWYVPHHFVFYPIALGSAVISARFIYTYRHQTLIWIAVAGIFLLLTWLAYMTRQHYALNNQNRIMRLEMRLRYYQLTRQRLEPIEAQLSFDQLAALRFASDEELPALVQRAVKEHLSGDDIKRSIRHWLPDTMRV